MYLLGWVPLNFATELFATLPSLQMRGLPAVVELASHAVVAMICAAAGWATWAGAPAARALAAGGVIAAAVVSVQSLYWTVLPRNFAPSDRLPLAALAFVHTAFWLFMLSRPPRNHS